MTEELQNEVNDDTKNDEAPAVDEILAVDEAVVAAEAEGTEEFAGHATADDDEDRRLGWGCQTCATFEFDKGLRRGPVERMACSSCGGKITYQEYSSWKRSRVDLFG